MELSKDTRTKYSSCALQGEAILGKRFSVVAEYVLKVLGLDYVAGGSAAGSFRLTLIAGACHRLSSVGTLLLLTAYNTQLQTHSWAGPCSAASVAARRRGDFSECFTCRPLHTASMCSSAQITLLLTHRPASADRRLTTGEMLVSPSKVIFADEISTGLDSSTTFQIIQNLSHYAHKRKVRL